MSSIAAKKTVNSTALEASTAAVMTFQIASIDLHPTDPDIRDIRTLPELVEFKAAHQPHYLLCLQARTPLGPLSVPHGQMKEAIVQCSEWFAANVKELRLPSRQDDGTIAKGQPIALLMENDVRLWIHLLSLLSLGVPVSVMCCSAMPENADWSLQVLIEVGVAALRATELKGHCTSAARDFSCRDSGGVSATGNKRRRPCFIIRFNPRFIFGPIGPVLSRLIPP